MSPNKLIIVNNKRQQFWYENRSDKDTMVALFGEALTGHQFDEIIIVTLTDEQRKGLSLTELSFYDDCMHGHLQTRLKPNGIITYIRDKEAKTTLTTAERDILESCITDFNSAKNVCMAVASQGKTAMFSVPLELYKEILSNLKVSTVITQIYSPTLDYAILQICGCQIYIKSKQ